MGVKLFPLLQMGLLGSSKDGATVSYWGGRAIPEQRCGRKVLLPPSARSREKPEQRWQSCSRQASRNCPQPNLCSFTEENSETGRSGLRDPEGEEAGSPTVLYSETTAWTLYSVPTQPRSPGKGNCQEAATSRPVSRVKPQPGHTLPWQPCGQIFSPEAPVCIKAWLPRFVLENSSWVPRPQIQGCFY